MTQPISEQILNNVATVIAAIDTPTYNQKINQVSRREGTPWTAFTNYPAVDIWLVSNAKTDEETEGFRDCHMEVEIRAYTRDHDNPDQALSFLAADIEKALMVDHTRGALAEDTDIDFHEHHFADEKMDPTGMVEITLDIKYMHRRTDPYSQ